MIHTIRTIRNSESLLTGGGRYIGMSSGEHGSAELDGGLNTSGMKNKRVGSSNSSYKEVEGSQQSQQSNSLYIAYTGSGPRNGHHFNNNKRYGGGGKSNFLGKGRGRRGSGSNGQISSMSSGHQPHQSHTKPSYSSYKYNNHTHASQTVSVYNNHLTSYFLFLPKIFFRRL